MGKLDTISDGLRSDLTTVVQTEVNAEPDIRGLRRPIGSTTVLEENEIADRMVSKVFLPHLGKEDPNNPGFPIGEERACYSFQPVPKLLRDLKAQLFGENISTRANYALKSMFALIPANVLLGEGRYLKPFQIGPQYRDEQIQDEDEEITFATPAVAFVRNFLLRREKRPYGGGNFVVGLEQDPSLEELDLSDEDKCYARAASLAVSWFEKLDQGLEGSDPALTRIPYISRLFAKTVPESGCDTMYFPDNPTTLIISSKGNLFEIEMYEDGRLKDIEDIFRTIKRIQTDTKVMRGDSIAYMGLTSMDRDQWAQSYKLISTGERNSRNVKRILDAGLIMALEPEVPKPESLEELQEYLRTPSINTCYDAHCLKVAGGGVAGIVASHEANDGDQVERFLSEVSKHADTKTQEIGNRFLDDVEGESDYEALSWAITEKIDRMVPVWEMITEEHKSEQDRRYYESFELDHTLFPPEIRDFWNKMDPPLPYNEVMQLAIARVTNKLRQFAGEDDGILSVMQAVNTCIIPGGRVSMAYMTSPAVQEFIDLMQKAPGEVDYVQDQSPKASQLKKAMIDAVLEQKKIRLEAKAGNNPHDHLAALTVAVSTGLRRTQPFLRAIYGKVDPTGIDRFNMGNTVGSNGGQYEKIKVFGSTAMNPEGNIFGYLASEEGYMRFECVLGPDVARYLKNYQEDHPGTTLKTLIESELRLYKILALMPTSSR